MMRRAAGLVGAAVLAVLVVTPTARAERSTDNGPWAGSELTTPVSTTTTPKAITATFVRAHDSQSRLVATTTFDVPSDIPSGCTNPTVGPTTVTDSGTSFATSAAVNPDCNGQYTITVTGMLQTRDCFLGGCGSWKTVDTHLLDGTIDVEAPAAQVTGVDAAAGEDRSVVITWDASPATSPDYLGYRIERVTASGNKATIAKISDPTATSYTDAAPPAEGGETTYTVYRRRKGVDQELSSAPASSSTAVEPAPESPPTDPGDPSGPGTPGTPGGPTAPGAPGDPTASTVPGPGRATTSGRVATPRLGITGTFLPPLLRPSADSIQPPATVDAGFSGELPYGEAEPGSDDPVLPDDELASAFGENGAGRGMAIPVATALVLAVWAFHLRFLARASRPVS